MSYTADPVRDAAIYYDKLDAESEKLEAQEAYYADLITEAFTSDLTKVSDTKLLQVPYVTGNPGKIKYQPIGEAIGDLIAYDDVFNQLLKVLRTSPCAEVANLRAAMAKRYSDQWASELGEFSL